MAVNGQHAAELPPDHDWHVDLRADEEASLDLMLGVCRTLYRLTRVQDFHCIRIVGGLVNDLCLLRSEAFLRAQMQISTLVKQIDSSLFRVCEENRRIHDVGHHDVDIR